MSLDCGSGMTSGGGTIDFAYPETAEEARQAGWPESPEQAARNTMGAPAFSRSFEDLTLNDGVPKESAGGRSVIQFALTDYDGRVQGILGVEEVLAGFWGTTQIDRCSPFEPEH